MIAISQAIPSPFDVPSSFFNQEEKFFRVVSLNLCPVILHIAENLELDISTALLPFGNLKSTRSQKKSVMYCIH
jgi:hypothetical protein